MRVVFIQDGIDFFRGAGHSGLERKKWIQRHKEDNTTIVIGDSHTYFFSGQEVIRPRKIMYYHGAISSSQNLLPEFSPIHIGPVLAYNANKYGTKTQGLEKVEYLIKKRMIKPGDRVLFCYGEIDIRNHVVRQASAQAAPEERVVDKILENYLAFLISMRKRGLRVACWGPTPSFPDTEQPNDAFPVHGDEITRNKVTLYFNEQLKNLCRQNSLVFVSIAEKLVDEHCRIRPDYFYDGCHLNQTAWVLIDKEQFRQF